MKPGERFQLRNCPEHRGTITRVYPDGGFRVTYDDPYRQRGQARMRVDFKAYQADFLVPEGSIEIRLVEGENEDDNGILNKLLSQYGLSSR